MMKLVTILLTLTLSRSEVSDLAHMQSCVGSVREAVSSRHESIDRLIRQAEGKIETVILYLLRVCYFGVERSSESYHVSDLLIHATTAVPSFSDREFALLREITTMEAFSSLGKKVENVPSISLDWGGSLMFALFTSVILPLFVWRSKTYRTVT